MNSDICISPIGKVVSPLTQKFGVPRQPNLVPVIAEIVLNAPYHHPDSVKGLEGFSHIWVLWQFHEISVTQGFRPLVRPPRLGGNAKIGVFASRSMFRPNKIGMSVVALEHVVIDNNQARLIISGADMIDGTPVLDIKPYIAYSDSVASAQSGYAVAAPAIQTVVWQQTATADFERLCAEAKLHREDAQVIEQLIAQDPRPAYVHSQRNATCAKQPNHVNQHDVQNLSKKRYTMRYATVDVVFYEHVHCVNVSDDDVYSELVIAELIGLKTDAL